MDADTLPDALDEVVMEPDEERDALTHLLTRAVTDGVPDADGQPVWETETRGERVSVSVRGGDLDADAVTLMSGLFVGEPVVVLERDTRAEPVGEGEMASVPEPATDADDEGETFGERVGVELADGLPESEGVPEMRGVADSDAERDGEPVGEIEILLTVGLGRGDCVLDTE